MGTLLVGRSRQSHTRHSIIFFSLALTAALALSWATAPSTALACGGFFCSQSTGGQPVDQAGEDIVYILDTDRSMTMIVRIVYQGRPDQFAWILPVPVAPASIDVGPETLFQQLAGSTSPTFALGLTTEGTCREEPACDFGSTGCSLGCSMASPSSTVSFSDGAVSARDAGSVVVVSEGVVGPYQTAVLAGTDATELHMWLADNGYDLPDTAIPIIADYLAAGELFVALRLRGELGTDAIEPVMLRFDALEQACLPIRLTAIATTPMLPIRAYFLATSPVAPTNYSLLDPPLEPGLFMTSPTIPPLLWTQVWMNAVEGAGGQAWIRDYAGAPVPVSVALQPTDAIATAAPGPFLSRVLQEDGYPRGAVLGILAGFVELADPGASLADWMDSCARRLACPAPTRWDPAGLAAALDAALRVPFGRVHDAFGRLPQLTRLYTTLAAEDMTLDPEFTQDAGLTPQSNAHVGTLVTECSPTVFLAGAAQRMDFSHGDSVRLREANPALDADAACRARGARGARHDGCTATLGYDPRTRPFVVVVGLVLAFVFRRRRLVRK